MNSEDKTQSDDAKALYEIVKRQETIIAEITENYKQAQIEIQKLEFKNEHLELQLRKALQQHFGRKADKVPANQLSMFDEAEVTVPVEELEIENAEITVPEHQRKKPGRKPLPKDLTRTVVEHDLTIDDKICKCGAEL